MTNSGQQYHFELARPLTGRDEPKVEITCYSCRLFLRRGSFVESPEFPLRDALHAANNEQRAERFSGENYANNCHE